MVDTLSLKIYEVYSNKEPIGIRLYCGELSMYTLIHPMYYNHITSLSSICTVMVAASRSAHSRLLCHASLRPCSETWELTQSISPTLLPWITFANTSHEPYSEPIEVTMLATKLDWNVFLVNFSVVKSELSSRYAEIVSSFCFQGDGPSWPSARYNYACLYTNLVLLFRVGCHHRRPRNENHSHMYLWYSWLVRWLSGVCVRNSCLLHGLSLDSMNIHCPLPGLW